eukprot:GHVH01002066.1.p1 GENE.GHVH01002066.1~~GHVH01002066.1.p1  ORF type:complete len:248 (+),score=25.17 GHVH01002066.1:824-1567(+)
MDDQMFMFPLIRSENFSPLHLDQSLFAVSYITDVKKKLSDEISELSWVISDHCSSNGDHTSPFSVDESNFIRSKCIAPGAYCFTERFIDGVLPRPVPYHAMQSTLIGSLSYEGRIHFASLFSDLCREMDRLQWLETYNNVDSNQTTRIHWILPRPYDSLIVKGQAYISGVKSRLLSLRWTNGSMVCARIMRLHELLPILDELTRLVHVCWYQKRFILAKGTYRPFFASLDHRINQMNLMSLRDWLDV